MNDHGSTCGCSLDGFRTDPAELARGMVIQLAIPHAFVVLRS